jgi:hypothetical protein
MDLKEIEKRLRVLEDIEAIKQLHVRYVNYLTITAWDDLLDCFSRDGRVEFTNGSARGRAAIEKLYKGKISITHIGQEGNLVVHPIIKVDGDKATGSWLLYTHFAQPHKIQIDPSPVANAPAPDWSSGYYEMEYVREDGAWKISLLKWTKLIASPRNRKM